MPLNKEEIEQLRDDILGALNQGGALKEIHIQLQRFVSHLESEQRISMEHGRKLEDHQIALYGNSEKDGLRSKVKTLEEYITERKRQNSAILLCVLGLVIKAGWEMFTKH